MHIPLGVEYAVAVARLESARHGAVALVYLDMVLVVDVPQDVVAGNGVTAVAEEVFADVLFVDNARLLLVETLLDGDGFHSVVFILLLFLVEAEERHVLAPAGGRGALLVFLVELVYVFLAEQDGALADGEEQVVVLLHVVILAELVQIGGGKLEVVLLHPVGQNLLSLLLDFTVFAAQDGLYLCLGFGRRAEVNPRGLHVLCLGREDFYLVATLQLVAQRHQLVVDFGADAVAAEEGMDLEGEVEGGAAGGHGLDFALGGEDENL